jgi:hypothetical protein
MGLSLDQTIGPKVPSGFRLDLATKPVHS